MIAFFDIDTQLDFLFPAGALYVPGAARLLGSIAALNRHAAARGVPLLSTMDAHSENDVEFRLWQPHCVVGTNGQAKACSTLLEKRVVVPSHTAAFEPAPQMLIEKQTVDCFTNMNLAPLLNQLGVTECVVYGLATDVCVKISVNGLLATGRKVQVITDAVASLNLDEGQRFLAAVPTTNTADVLAKG